MLRTAHPDIAKRLSWGAILTLVTVASTLAVACGTPFVALGTLGALYLPRRDAFLLVAVNWGVNQAIGFGWLHYPHTQACYFAGIAVGLAALLCTWAAQLVSSALQATGTMVRSIGSFGAAFVVYEGLLFALSPSSSGKAFALPIVAYIGWVNAIAFVALLFIKMAASALGFAFPSTSRMLKHGRMGWT